ncbi:protease SohB [Corallincola holothuriorum]|uniref:Protease SohB n=1 Tax=Corallincola holothuriorum TaxID=2282215 RepID=A0A368NJ83_9GAMM|nr:protease SohB [Corallincola holothuriorum]RCU50498.1 protease SohB [Corallincola holothuriorum]
MEFLYEYGLFLAKAVTLVIAIVLTVVGVVAAAASAKGKDKKGHLEVTDLSKQISEQLTHLQEKVLSKPAQKLLEKTHKAEAKAQQKAVKKAEKEGKEDTHKRVFVIDFKGSMDAREVDSLREEVSAVLSIANKDTDELLVRLESPGGMVHGYGLAASQLARVRTAGLPMTVAVDKVAASGGYMMACVADKILAAPFSIIGSIGVVAQMPNFNKLLKKNEIEFEQHTAGEFKRTLTMFGENDDHAREKFKQDLEEIHERFKSFIAQFRPALDLEQVATGEHWLGGQALELGLVDEIGTSDDYLLNAVNTADNHVFKVQYATKKKLSEKLAKGVAHGVDGVLARFYDRLNAGKFS